MRMRIRPVLLGVVALVLLAGCGGGANGDPLEDRGSAAPDLTPETTPPPVPAPPGDTLRVDTLPVP